MPGVFLLRTTMVRRPRRLEENEEEVKEFKGARGGTDFLKPCKLS